MTDYTEREVREHIAKLYFYYTTDTTELMLTQLADMLAEREKAEPIGWVFQNEETGQMTFCENDGINNAENFAANNPRHVLCGHAYTRPAAQPRVPDGYVMVPIEPTDAMIEAAERRNDDEPPNDWGKYMPAPHSEIYKAMVLATKESGR